MSQCDGSLTVLWQEMNTMSTSLEITHTYAQTHTRARTHTRAYTRNCRQRCKRIMLACKIMILSTVISNRCQYLFRARRHQCVRIKPAVLPSKIKLRSDNVKSGIRHRSGCRTGPWRRSQRRARFMCLVAAGRQIWRVWVCRTEDWGRTSTHVWMLDMRN